mmetsp:Transcript_3232/g.5187  ORF Transcript_3232/g.5187 Transcript_3232/m.5187 type:complete len:126 (-) Transcript_3232:1367-1744(-)
MQSSHSHCQRFKRVLDLAQRGILLPISPLLWSQPDVLFIARIHGSVLNFVGPMPPRAMQEKETSSGLWPHRPAVGFPKGKKEKVSRTITTALVVAYSANDTSYLQVIPKVLQSLQLSRERMTLSC